MANKDVESNKDQKEIEPMTLEGKVAKEENQVKKNRSLKVKMQQAQRESPGRINFITAAIAIIIGSVFGLIFLALGNALSIAQIAIGSIYFHDCPVRTGIPIILIINGCISILVSVLEAVNNKLGKTLRSQTYREENQIRIKAHFTIVLTFFRLMAVASFIAWCVLVYGSDWPDFDDSNSQNYCHSTLFLFAFWLLNIYFIILLFVTLCCCCCCWFAAHPQ